MVPDTPEDSTLRDTPDQVESRSRQPRSGDVNYEEFIVIYDDDKMPVIDSFAQSGLGELSGPVHCGCEHRMSQRAAQYY